MTSALRRFASIAVGAMVITGCARGEAAEEGPRLLTVQATRGSLTLRAEATGTVEPVREVEVKSKASGEVLRLHADVGDRVDRGTLLAEIDPRDVRNRYNQVQADLQVAQARLEISAAQLERSTALLEASVITPQEHENATLDYANAQASLVRAQTDFELAELQLADVSIRAPMAGTIIQKNIEEGAVIQSASSNVSGGTALFIMADLNNMQVRTLVDETDMGDLQAGLQTAVRVEAFPDRTFRGQVQKIEPQAQVEQNVTMFPVIVSLDNRAGLLKPGMNAEVEVFIDEVFDAVLVPNNAIVQATDVGPAALALGLELNDVDLQQFMRAGGRGAFNGDRAGGGNRAGGADGGSGAEGESADAPTEEPTEAADLPREPSGGASQGGNATGRLQELRAQAQSGAISQDSMRSALQALRGQAAGTGAGAFRGAMDTGEGAARDTRPAAVFVMGAGGVPEPRLVQLGIGDWDNTQVVSGVEEGETLVIVGAAQLQAQQQEFLDRMRSRNGGNPFGGGGPGGGRGR
jgi:HlyD family secretion protein